MIHSFRTLSSGWPSLDLCLSALVGTSTFGDKHMGEEKGFGDTHWGILHLHCVHQSLSAVSSLPLPNVLCAWKTRVNPTSAQVSSKNNYIMFKPSSMWFPGAETESSLSLGEEEKLCNRQLGFRRKSFICPPQRGDKRTANQHLCSTMQEGGL